MGPWIFAGMLIVVGGVFAVVGWASTAGTRRRRAGWIAVQGTVTGLAAVRGSGKTTTYAPVYTYFFDGMEHSATSDVSSAPPACKEGDPIPLLVNPLNGSESVAVDRRAEILILVMTVIGFLLLTGGLLAAWAAAAGWMPAR